MVDFAGWHMPVQYSGLVDEHTAVRERAGLFDVSHMGEIRLRGADALANVQRLTVNDASTIVDGQAQYTAMVNEEGGIIDDLLVYRMGEEDYLLVVNAGTTTKDYEWIAAHVAGDVELTNESADWAQIALQGPQAEAVLGTVLGPTTSRRSGTTASCCRSTAASPPSCRAPGTRARTVSRSISPRTRRPYLQTRSSRRAMRRESCPPGSAPATPSGSSQG